jgi:clan AA aspartic protease
MMKPGVKNKRMGFVYVTVNIANPAQPERTRALEVLVDTGAILSVIPRVVLEELGIRPITRRRFKAFGGNVLREVGGVLLEYGGDIAFAQVIFGEEGDAAIIGVTALETLGYQVDSTTGQLKPTEMLML